ncbi:MAG: LAGLIDADG family homing endonuclease [Candidatus Omnitrophica bacterium]|nr:LAGLIDADG family homing endonuclease [Candidatus Omnitrophota bacterium]
MTKITTDYIAGFFDADGHFNGRAIIIANKNKRILEAIQDKLKVLGIASTLRQQVEERQRRDEAIPYICYRHTIYL